MDYSTLPNDPDHPVGTSPWQSSPQPGGPPSPPMPKRSSYANTTEGHLEEDDNDRDRISEGAYQQQQQQERGHQGYQAENGGSSDSEQRYDQDGQESRQQGYQQQPQQQGQQQQQQQRGAGPNRYRGTTRPVHRQNLPQYKLQAKITALERTGRKDPVLRFDVHTNLPKFRTTQFRDVRRTHSEFVKLADHLISSNPEAFVPAMPPSLTSAGAGTVEDEARVKSSLQRWFNYVCGNEVLMRDEEMILFVQSDSGYSPVIRMKQPATGVRRKVIKQFAPPPDNTPELHEARPIVKLFYLETMETGQKLDRAVKSRRGLGLAESDLGVKLGVMHVQETHPGLGSAFRKVGKIIQKTGDFHAEQATAAATTLGDPLNYHSSDAFIVKETLTNRHILLRDLIAAQQTTRSKLAAADRLKASSSVRREKVDEAISALDEASSNELYLAQKTQRVTANLLHEKRRWFARTAADLRTSIREYVLREIEAERRTLATLESVRPDVRAIDASGGLSRLGREAHPTFRRPSMASSQGPKGDAWSGLPRRSDALDRSMSGSFPATVPEESGGGMNGGGEDKVGGGRSGGGGGGAGGGGSTGHVRAVSNSSLKSNKDEDDEDRVDAKNAASRLATSTF